MKKVALVLFICLVAVINGYSQTKQESIKELFHLMQKDSIIDRKINSMLPTILKMTQPKDSTFTESKRNALNSQLQFAKDLSAKAMIDEMALFDKYFSQNEINDFVAFYKSPSGKKLINVSPDIQKDLMVVMMQKYMPVIQKSIKAKGEEIKNAAK